MFDNNTWFYTAYCMNLKYLWKSCITWFCIVSAITCAKKKKTAMPLFLRWKSVNYIVIYIACIIDLSIMSVVYQVGMLCRNGLVMSEMRNEVFIDFLCSIMTLYNEIRYILRHEFS